MLFSGTISRYSGADKALDIMIELIKREPDSKGIMIGQIHDKNLKQELESKAKDNTSIKLITSEYPIGYQEILDAIDWATLGIISYQPNEINKDKIPTKLYEYSRYQLPFLLQRESLWEVKGTMLGGSIPIEIEAPDYDLIIEKLSKNTDLFPDTYPQIEAWEFEATKLINIINTFN